MKLDFDNLAVYAASIGVWKPIRIEWDADLVCEPYDENEKGPDSYHRAVSYDGPPDETGTYAYHEIGLDPREDRVETLLKGLRHELEHARQLEALGYFEWMSSYWWYTELLITSGPDIAAQYHWNPYEVEADEAMNREWRDLLPCVKGLEA